MKLKPLTKPMNKKGSILDIFIWIIVSFIIVIFFAVWIYGFNSITNTLVGIKDSGGSMNISVSAAAQDTFGKINPAQTSGLHILAFVMIFMMGLSILITNFVVKSHPVFFIIYIFIIIAAVIVSVYISNEYETLMTDPVLGETISEFTGASFIMLHLPLWSAVIGIFGAIFLFAGILRDAGVGGSIT